MDKRRVVIEAWTMMKEQTPMSYPCEKTSRKCMELQAEQAAKDVAQLLKKRHGH